MTILLFNKPYNVLCQFSKDGDWPTLKDFIDIPNIYPAGRLDRQSEGLVLLTDDGKIQHQLSHPKFGKSKSYWVQVEGVPTIDDLIPLIHGLKYQGVQYLPAQVSLISEPNVWERIPPIRHRVSVPTSWLEITLQEGKNHQVRKMTASIGFPTLRLIRHRIAKYTIEGLNPGQWREVKI